MDVQEQPPRQWAVYEDGGELRVQQVEKVNERTYRLGNEQKIAHQRVWMLLDKYDRGIAKKARVLAADVDVAALRTAAKGAEQSADELFALSQPPGAEGFDNDNKAESKGEDKGESAGEDESERSARRLAVLQAVLAHPAYFHRARGKLRPAGDAALAAALADMEGKRLMRQQCTMFIGKLRDGEMPEQIASLRDAILTGKANNSAEYAAVKKVAGSAPDRIAKFFCQHGLLKDARAYWQVLFDEAWPADADDKDGDGGGIIDAPVLQAAAAVAAFSIDDAGTFEIDDAFSAAQVDNNKWRIGIHIAAPALGVVCGGAADVAAFAKMTSVYFPDGKRPMLPMAALEKYSLQIGKPRPVLSAYFDFEQAKGGGGNVGTFSPGATVLESLTLHSTFAPEEMDKELPPVIAGQYAAVADFAKVLQDDNDRREGGEKGHPVFAIDPPSVKMRPRAPSSFVVEAMMRLVNRRWGERIAQSGGGLYRREGMTRAHYKKADGHYAWLSSPLRRYADLANQRLLLSLLYGYDDGGIKDWKKLASLFDGRYARAKRHQRIVERHYALAALARDDKAVEGELEADGKKRRIRLNDYPLMGKVQTKDAASSSQMAKLLRAARQQPDKRLPGVFVRAARVDLFRQLALFELAAEDAEAAAQ